uniref:K(+)-insensitive pyrophosphate-energized proton pump n=1 Tax=Fervidicoccus fontis TaxID=683846 RepID=A0A7J3ZL26_9CREN
MADAYVVLSLVIGLVGLALSLFIYRFVERLPMGTERMVEIWRAIREGSAAYMRRQFKTIFLFSLVMAAVASASVYLGYRARVLSIHPQLSHEVFMETLMIGVSVVLGSLASLTAAFLSMDASTKANVRTTEAARRGTWEALKTAVFGGSVLGFSVPSMSLFGLSALYLLYSVVLGGSNDNPFTVRLALDGLAGFAFGASLAALFAQLGGGIYTKAADIGADLVGKVEAGIPEDDPRNPAVIADQVGDNVGDCAGRGADIFESVTAEMLGSMLIGWAVYFLLLHAGFAAQEAIKFVFIPLLIGGVGVLATIPGVLVSGYQKRFKEPVEPLRNGVFVSSIATVVGFALVYKLVVPELWVYLFISTLCGVATAILIVLVTNMYTASKAKAVVEIAEASQSGPAITILQGLSVGMRATFLPIVIISIALVAAFVISSKMPVSVPVQETIGGFAVSEFVFGVYGTALATMGMLALAGIIMTLDGAGPITDNAGGIAEMSGLEEEVRERLEPLDALGNVTKALTKGYAMGSAALAALLLFQAFVQDYVARDPQVISFIDGDVAISLTGFVSSLKSFLAYILLVRPEIVMSLIVGAMIPFFFTALALKAVARAAFHMVEEVRRQFRERPGILEGREKPDYYRAVDISTRYALKSMAGPSMVVILAPLLIGLFFGGPAVGALVIGATASAIALAITMMWGGAAWDNAKKYIEMGFLGGKGSPTHAAAVVGDTVGDPLKDTAGPSLHIVIKLLNTISLVFIPLYMIWLLRFVFG